MQRFQIELRHLNAFVAVAEELHFGRAADRLGVTQSPLSRQIQQLEAELGTTLFERTARGVALTAAGQSYLDAVRPLLRELHEANLSVHAAGRGLLGRLRVGFVSNLGYTFVPTLLELVAQRAPRLAIELFEEPTQSQIRGLHDRRLDVALVTLPVSDDGLTMRRLLREPLVVMLPADHWLTAHERIELASLANEKFIVCPRYRETGFHDVIQDLCAKAGFTALIAHQVTSKATARELVAAHLGVSIVPQSATVPSHRGIAFRPLSESLLIENAIVWRPEAMSPALRLFADCSIETTRTAGNQVSDAPAPVTMAS